MCGLIGFVGNTTLKVQDAVKLMLFFDQLRGVDSTGIASIQPDGGIDMFKKAVNATDFLEFSRTSAIIKDFQANAIIGHNRAATKGAVNNTNAHPFEVGDILLAHNGTLRKQHLLPESKDFEVDSENIAYAIDKDGVEATLKRLCGAFALSYYDGRDNTINLVRNEERPLYTATVKSHTRKDDVRASGLLWASEPWMITVACAKAGLELVSTPVLLPVGQLLTVDITLRNIVDINTHITTKDMVLYEEPLALVGKDVRNNAVDFIGAYRFTLTRRKHYTNSSSYLYEGSTTDGKFKVTLSTSVDLDINYIYSAKCRGYSMLGGESVLDMGNYTKQELIAGKKPMSGLVERSH